MASPRPRRMLDPRQIEEIDPAIAAVLRGKSVAERIEMLFSANRTARLLIKGNIPTHHPEWTPDQIKREVAPRILLGSN